MERLIDPGQNRLLPGGVPSALPDGRYVMHASAGHCWDQHGFCYRDFICGYGAVILGHACEEVNRSISEQLERGLLTPGPSPRYGELADTLCRLLPTADDSLFFKTGSEAVTAAIRLARAYSGRSQIVRCGFHGWHDQVVEPYISWHRYEPEISQQPRVAGIPEGGPGRFVHTWDGEDWCHLEKIFTANGGDLAALILDPVQLHDPIDLSLLRLRNLAHTHSALLILDESKSALRVHLGGVQGLYGIAADLTVFGKCLANGLPLSTVLGSRAILSLARNARIMGTFNGELASIAAALHTISILSRPGNIARIWALGQRLIDGANAILAQHKLSGRVSAVPYRWPCMPFLWFREPGTRVWQADFYRQMARRGVLMLPHHMNFLCIEHTTDDIDEALQVMDESLTSLAI